MSLPNCLAAEICVHYEASGTVSGKADHYVRVTVPCKRYLAMDCEILEALATLETFATGKPIACSITKSPKYRKGGTDG